MVGSSPRLAIWGDEGVEVVDEDDVHGVAGMLGQLLDDQRPMFGELPHGLGVTGHERRWGAEQPLVPGQRRSVVADGDSSVEVDGHAAMLTALWRRLRGSNPVQRCSAIRGQSAGPPVTCDSHSPSMTARARRGPAVPDAVRTQHGSATSCLSGTFAGCVPAARSLGDQVIGDMSVTVVVRPMPGLSA